MILGSRKIPRRIRRVRFLASGNGMLCCSIASITIPFALPQSTTSACRLAGSVAFYRFDPSFDCPGTLRHYGMRARTLEPPFTFSPTFTRISASLGSHKSTREPNRTSPMRSPRATSSPAFFHDTTRRATQPAICLYTISPCSVACVNTFCSFWRDALSSHAARNFPGL